ncbi:MAG TPA: post-COAP-1 domain-containing protein, partial [Pyrinomonadaceae bacterium]|nr:post-COAP-1 domain-containing protein [Pyrinomonadaceae bacterium]
ADGNTNLLQNRPAWTGNSGGFITTRVQLPAAAAGKNVRFRWIAGADGAFTPTGAGWTIDNVALVEGYQCAAVATTTTVGAATVQYSDQTTLSATVSSTCFDPVGTVEFKVNGTSVGSAPVNGGGTVSVPYTTLLAAGTYSITADFVSSNPRYLNSAGANTLTVTKEDALVTPSASNPVAVKVNSAGGTAGPITVCADIAEAADGQLGDISNAQPVAFSFAPVGAGAAPAQSAVTYTGGGTGGTLRACVTLSNVAVNVYDVTVNVGGNYYTGTGGTVLAVFDPSLGFVTGGGTIVRDGVTATFGFNVKYLKNGTAQGSLLYVEHQPGGIVKLKSNVMQTLSIAGPTGIILGKATLNGVGNYGFRATAIDNGETGATDQFGLQVTAPSGAAVPSLSFAPLTLNGGQIQVPQQSKR